MKERAVKCTGGSDSYRASGKSEHVDYSCCLTSTLRRNDSQAGGVQQSKSWAGPGGNQEKRKHHPNVSVGGRHERKDRQSQGQGNATYD